MGPETLLRRMFARAVEVADPMHVLGRHLPPRPQSGRVVVVGAGKASARMAEAVETAWGPCEGLIITRYGHARPCKGIEIVEAAHPVPDRAGTRATGRMLNLLRSLGPDDFALALISGGASALLCAPATGLTLKDKQDVNARLLASGAPIGQMNVVRKHLSGVKGGRLAAAAYPAAMLALMISDVPGDDPADIGSGPTVGEASSPADAAAILQRWDVNVSDRVRAVLARAGGTIRPSDVRLSRVENRVIAAPAQSLRAAAAVARGFDIRILGDALEGEARDVAAAQAEAALELQAALAPGASPVLVLSGGELTVTRRGHGVGGPNAEFCLALAIALNGAPGIHAIACDTDGIDGGADVAGAVIGPDLPDRAAAAGRDPRRALADNDAHGFFAAVGAQVITGPTLTNVNDFRAVLIEPA